MSSDSDRSSAQRRVLEMLVDAVRLLAADAPEQRRFFPEWIDVCNEMACYLGDSIDLLRANGGLTALSAIQIAQLDALRARMQKLYSDRSGPSDAPQDPASAAWNSIRHQARELLREHRWDAPPSGGFVSFIPG